MQAIAHDARARQCYADEDATAAQVFLLPLLQHTTVALLHTTMHLAHDNHQDHIATHVGADPARNDGHRFALDGHTFALCC